MRVEDRHLKLRGRRWHYVRRVPAVCAEYDRRGFIRQSLKTSSLEIARRRRDELERADDLYWSALARREDGALERYQAALARALTLDLQYVSASDIAVAESIEQILTRVEALGAAGGAHELDVEAALGGVERPKTSVMDAFGVYLEKISADEIAQKSPAQKRQWEKVKRRAVNNFIALAGNIALEDITRESALQFYEWWSSRINPGKTGVRALSASAGNRDIGNMRRLYADFFCYIGEEERLNPFRNLSFSAKIVRDIPPFPSEWIEARILAAGALKSLNSQARHIVYALIETGARPSEICNLAPENIRLDCEVPYIAIRPRAGREIKTKSSIRDIPLIGVSLAAFREFPNGFERYHDKENSLSALLNKYFRTNDLFPDSGHRIYSFRHSFEKRMLEGGLDYGLRCMLMGHATDRPAYGDGGSLAFRRDELLKISLKYQ